MILQSTVASRWLTIAKETRAHKEVTARMMAFCHSAALVMMATSVGVSELHARSTSTTTVHKIQRVVPVGRARILARCLTTAAA